MTGTLFAISRLGVEDRLLVFLGMNGVAVQHGDEAGILRVADVQVRGHGLQGPAAAMRRRVQPPPFPGRLERTGGVLRVHGRCPHQ